MEQKVVNSLERGVEKAVADAFMQMGLKRLPFEPSRRIMHLMAKAAVSVYEAAVEAGSESE